MKRILIAVLLLSITALSACANDTQPATVGTLTENDLIFVIDGTEFPLDSDVAPLLIAFGEDYTLTTAPSCLYDGEDKVFDYPFSSIYTYPIDGKDLIDEIFIFDGEYQTNKNIKIGSTLDEVKAQYGTNGYLVDSSYFYVLSGDVEDLESPKLFFDLLDDKVIGISYYAASNITE